MVRNLTPKEIHQFIVGDFRGPRNSIAANHHTAIGRGNFMFSRQAMTLLEFASRLYTNDATGIMQRNFSSELYKIELGSSVKYFQDGDLELKIDPDILFLDFEHAIDKSGLLLNKGLTFQYLSRPRSKRKSKSKISDDYYNFNTIQLEKSLSNLFRF
jgi:hypothetical protein